MLELNVQIAYKWYKQNTTSLPVIKLVRGLYNNDYNMNHLDRAILFFTKILSRLNDYAVGRIDLDPPTNHPPAMLRWSSNEWGRIWRDISKGNIFHMTKVSLACMYKSIRHVIQEYIPYTKSWFEDLQEWTPQNHCLHCKEVKDTVHTILLCQLRPECVHTFGSLPTHLIHNIIPWLLPSHDIQKLSNEDICMSFSNNAHMYTKIGGVQYFLNKLLEFPIHVQRAIFPMLRHHTSTYSSTSMRSIQDVERHIFRQYVQTFLHTCI